MTSYVARASLGLAGIMRKMGSSFDAIGKSIEITKYTEKLVPSTRFVAVDGIAPIVNEMSFVAPNASIIGNVTIGKESSVWYGAVLRGDVNKVTIGNQSSIGDRAVVHVAKIQSDNPTHIGNFVTIGAGAIVHAATIQNNVIIGEMAQILDGAIIESNTILLPASIVTPGTKVMSGELWGGSPAKKVRSLTVDEINNIQTNALNIVLLASDHVQETNKSYEQILEEEEVADIQMYFHDNTAAPMKKPDIDISDVLGQGHPGRIFRSTLTHPEEAYQHRQKQQQQEAANKK